MDPYTPAPEQQNVFPKKPAKPFEHPGSRFAKFSVFLGGLSIVTAAMGTVIFPFIFGGLALILVILSRGADRKFLPAAKLARFLACVGLVLNVGIIGSAIFMFYTNADFREAFHTTVNKRYKSVYGGDFDADWADFLEQYGIEEDPLGLVEGGAQE